MTGVRIDIVTFCIDDMMKEERNTNTINFIRISKIDGNAMTIV